MLVSGFGDASVDEVDAETGAEKRLLDVVGRERVAGEEQGDVAAANQLAHGRSAAGVDDCRAADDQRLLAFTTIVHEVACDFADECALGLFGGYAARHESEIVPH